MHPELRSRGREEVTDLQCAVVDCRTNIRLWTRVPEFDGLGNPVPRDQQGPYLQHWYGTGRDYGEFLSGSLYSLYRADDDSLRVRPSALRFNNSPYAHDQALMPNFGFGVNREFWICQACTRIHGGHPEELKQIVLAAAAAEGEDVH